MKKRIKYFIVVLLSVVISFLGYNIISKLKDKKELAERIRSIPDFMFRTVDGKPFTQKDLSKLKPKLFVYFNSECDFCLAEAKQIQENLEQLKTVQMVFITFEKPEEIITFANKYELLKRNNIIFVEDKKILFEELFDVQSIPYMILYSKDNQLIQKFKGVTNIKNVIKFLPSNKTVMME